MRFGNIIFLTITLACIVSSAPTGSEPSGVFVSSPDASSSSGLVLPAHENGVEAQSEDPIRKETGESLDLASELTFEDTEFLGSLLDDLAIFPEDDTGRNSSSRLEGMVPRAASAPEINGDTSTSDDIGSQGSVGLDGIKATAQAEDAQINITSLNNTDGRVAENLILAPVQTLQKILGHSETVKTMSTNLPTKVTSDPPTSIAESHTTMAASSTTSSPTTTSPTTTSLASSTTTTAPVPDDYDYEYPDYDDYQPEPPRPSLPFTIFDDTVARPPSSNAVLPSACTWGVIQCCNNPESLGGRVECFSHVGCPGTWFTDFCTPDTKRLVLKMVLKSFQLSFRK